MRYDTPIYFQSITPGEYDKTTGDYGPEVVTESERYASVTDTGTEAMTLVYGTIKQGSKVVRLQNHYSGAFDYIRIGDIRYQVDLARNLRSK